MKIGSGLRSLTFGKGRTFNQTKYHAANSISLGVLITMRMILIQLMKMIFYLVLLAGRGVHLALTLILFLFLGHVIKKLNVAL